MENIQDKYKNILYTEAKEHIWQIVQKLSLSEEKGGLPPRALDDMFGSRDLETILSMDIEEIEKAIAKWESDQTPRTSDIVYDLIEATYAVVTLVEGTGKHACCYIMYTDGSTTETEASDLLRTGVSINVHNFLDQIDIAADEAKKRKF